MYAPWQSPKEITNGYITAWRSIKGHALPREILNNVESLRDNTGQLAVKLFLLKNTDEAVAFSYTTIYNVV